MEENMIDNNGKQKQENKLDFSNMVKRVIINKFYIEFIIYILILNIGFGLGYYAKQSTHIKNLLIIYGLIISIVISIILYIFGYIIAKRRKGLNKLFPAISFFVIFIIFYYLSNAINNSVSQNVFTVFFDDLYAFIVTIHYYCFLWINELFDTEVSNTLFIILPSLFVFLGSKKNHKKEKKKRIIDERRKKIENNLSN